MRYDAVFDLSRAVILDLPKQITVRGEEVVETEFVPPVELDPPELLSATAGDTVVDLIWAPSTSEVAGYLAKWGTTTGVYGATLDVGAVTAAQITSLINDTEYFFVVSAYSGELESDNSNELSATPVAPAAVTYSFFRITVSANNGDPDFLGIRELEIRFEGVNQVTGRISEATTNSFNASFPPLKAFDGSYAAGDGWNTDREPTGWLQIELTEAVQIDGYALGGYSTDTRTGARSARDWILQGSNNGTDWTTLDTQTGITWISHDFSTPKVFSLS